MECRGLAGLRRAQPWAVALILGLQWAPSTSGEDVCTAPDSSGTALLPPSCDYVGQEPWLIEDGLPAGTTIEVLAALTDIAVVQEEAGGSLGGTVSIFTTHLKLSLRGTAELAGFERDLMLPALGAMHFGPRGLGDPDQYIAADLFYLQGQITSDPDFDFLRISSGTDVGLPSPGIATLTRLPSGEWAVDSFFDITYRIDFMGAAGGVLAERSGYAVGLSLIRIPGQGPTPTLFVRGEVNGQGKRDLSDAIGVLGFLFLGTNEPSCRKAADINDDGEIDLSDAVFLLGFLFLGTASPREPFGSCGIDPTPDSLSCDSFSPVSCP